MDLPEREAFGKFEECVKALGMGFLKPLGAQWMALQTCLNGMGRGHKLERWQLQ